MIVKSIIDSPEQPFDFFNDYKDTYKWLKENEHKEVAKILHRRNKNISRVINNYEREDPTPKLFTKRYRICLMCNKEFMSEGPSNRRCPDCSDKLKTNPAKTYDVKMYEYRGKGISSE